MDLNLIKDSFDRVTKKQKLCCSKTQEVFEQIIYEIGSALTAMQSDETNPQNDHKYILAELQKKLKEIAPISQLEGPQKELNIALTKYPKVLEKSFNSNISKAYRNVELDLHIINEIIASHLYRQGLFDIGDCFMKETEEPESVTFIKSTFSEMYQILEAMKSKNLEPALKWVAENSDKLREKGSDLELKLHQLNVLEIIIQKRNRNEAMQYLREHISPFGANHIVEIQKLAACTLWAGKLENCPYRDLLVESNWKMAAEEMTKQFCNLLGQSSCSPLSVTVAAGIQGLPYLLKYIDVLKGKMIEWQTLKQLPVPVELDSEFQFHSVFVCPVTWEQSTDENPPMLMTCGHVLCKQSICKMSKNNTKTFKCPYCPIDVDATQCKQLYF